MTGRAELLGLPRGGASYVPLWTAREFAGFLARYRGQRLLGVVTWDDCTEIVFARAGFGRSNLLCLYADGRHSFGGVAEPEGYVAADLEAA